MNPVWPSSKFAACICQRVDDALESTNAFGELCDRRQQTKGDSLQSHFLDGWSGGMPAFFGHRGLVFTGARWYSLVCGARLGLPFAPKLIGGVYCTKGQHCYVERMCLRCGMAKQTKK